MVKQYGILTLGVLLTAPLPTLANRQYYISLHFILSISRRLNRAATATAGNVSWSTAAPHFEIALLNTGA